jgi:V-type H+-transporting ATPase subunit a
MLLSTLSGMHPYLSLLRCVIFFTVTIGMMLTLDVMECLMHVVRLHWVEWMGKFYTGSGVLFVPEVSENYI